MNLKIKIKKITRKIRANIRHRTICLAFIAVTIFGIADISIHFKEYWHFWSEGAALIGSGIDAIAGLREKPDYLHNRALFRDFLKKTKALKACSSDLEKNPRAFISYAYGNDHSPKENIETKKIQKRLLMLQKDLEFLGIETFLDLQRMHGNLKDTLKQHLEQADFFILIGHPFLKRKATGKRLFLLHHFDEKLLPESDDCVVAIEARKDYMVYRVEQRHVKEVLELPLELDRIHWHSTSPGVQEARLSHETNIFLEQILSKFKSVTKPTISHIQFECGILMDKAYQNPSMLIPLVFKGSYTEAFPAVVQDNFIRDFRDEAQYFIQMSSLGNPLGVIPAIFPELIRNQDYIHLVQDLRNHLK